MFRILITKTLGSCWLPSTISASMENDGLEHRALNAVQTGKDIVEQSDDKVTKQESLPGEKVELSTVDDVAATEEEGEHTQGNALAVKSYERWASFVSTQIKGNNRIMAMLWRINDKLDDSQAP